ncbi:MAG: succinate dehydrogenase, cytochrome b556 subunit [Anaerolineae bacterium]
MHRDLAAIPRGARPGRSLAGWFDVRGRHVGTWAFALNRATGLLLVLYLGVHLTVLSLLARGPSAYDAFVAFASHPLVILFDLGLAAVLLYHGLNGVRLILLGLGWGLRWQRELFWALMVLGAAVWCAAAYGLAVHLLQGR